MFVEMLYTTKSYQNYSLKLIDLLLQYSTSLIIGAPPMSMTKVFTIYVFPKPIKRTQILRLGQLVGWFNSILSVNDTNRNDVWFRNRMISLPNPPTCEKSYKHCDGPCSASSVGYLLKHVGETNHKIPFERTKRSKVVSEVLTPWK